MLTAPRADLQLAQQSLPIGHQVVSVSVVAGRDAASSCSRRATGPAERSTTSSRRLTVIDFPTGFVAQAHRYTMPEPLGNLRSIRSPCPHVATRPSAADGSVCRRVRGLRGATRRRRRPRRSCRTRTRIVLFDLRMHAEDGHAHDPELRRDAPAARLHAGARASGRQGAEAAPAHRDGHRPDDARPRSTPSTSLPAAGDHGAAHERHDDTQPITTAGLAVDGRNADGPQRRALRGLGVERHERLHAAAGRPDDGRSRNDFVPTHQAHGCRRHPLRRRVRRDRGPHHGDGPRAPGRGPRAVDEQRRARRSGHQLDDDRRASRRLRELLARDRPGRRHVGHG